jgi:polyisoprenoid-binding protein YceI
MNKKIYLLIFLGFSFSCWSQSNIWKVNTQKSYVKYIGEHVLHNWEAINNNISGLIVYNGEAVSKIGIILNVIDFDSGNSSRDSHALEVLKALKFPIIKFYSEEIIANEKEYTIKGKFVFMGKTVYKTIRCNFQNSTTKLKIKGDFDLSLLSFGITLPSFMTFKIKDLIKISFDIEANKDENLK